MSLNLKKRLYEILEKAETGDVPSKIFDVSIMTLIVLNVIAVILETVQGLSSRFGTFFRAFEVSSVTIFSIEYLLRLWSCTTDRKYGRPVQGRLRFAVTPFALIDLIAILPFYLPMLIPVDLRILRAIRLLRMFRLFKLGRYSRALQTLGNVLQEKKEELLITVFTVILLLVLMSSFMFYVENKAQPDSFANIPQAMWWGVATLTTVGYGDVYPITPAGKLLGAVIALLGIGLFAMPAGILASGFAEVLKKGRGKRTICPHCGKDIDGGSRGIKDRS